MRLRVPATTTNFGAGFDTFGLALNLYNIFEFHESDAFGVEVKGHREGIATDERNLVIKVYRLCCERWGERERPFFLRQKNNVPPARGLGSSATAIVAGIEAFARLHKKELSLDEKLEIAFEFESHPDNLLPAFLGGFVICTDNRDLYMRFEFPEDLALLFAVPDFEVSTEEARKILPRQVDLNDAVFNIQRACLFVASLLRGDYDLLRTALGDRIHQPYRKKLVKIFERVESVALRSGALGVYISGSGPTVGVITKDAGSQKVKEALEREGKEGGWEVLELRASSEGVHEG